MHGGQAEVTRLPALTHPAADTLMEANGNDDGSNKM